MFQVETPEEDWIVVSDGLEEFEIKKDMKCDLCDKHIPSFVLCRDCKYNHRPKLRTDNTEDTNISEKKNEEESIIFSISGTCNFCEKDVNTLYSCKNCDWFLCHECKFGDDFIQVGVNCCEYSKKPKELFTIQHKLISQEDAKTSLENPVLSHEHRRLYKEFLELH